MRCSLGPLTYNPLSQGCGSGLRVIAAGALTSTCADRHRCWAHRVPTLPTSRRLQSLPLPREPEPTHSCPCDPPPCEAAHAVLPNGSANSTAHHLLNEAVHVLLPHQRHGAAAPASAGEARPNRARRLVDLGSERGRQGRHRSPCMQAGGAAAGTTSTRRTKRSGAVHTLDDTVDACTDG